MLQVGSRCKDWEKSQEESKRRVRGSSRFACACCPWGVNLWRLQLPPHCGVDAPTRACFAGRKCLLILMWCLFLFLPKGHSASWGHFSRTPEENSEQYPGDESTDEPNSVCGGLIDMCPPTPLPCGPAPLCPCMSELQFLSVLHGPETGSCSEDHGNRKKRPVINNEKSPRASRI